MRTMSQAKSDSDDEVWSSDVHAAGSVTAVMSAAAAAAAAEPLNGSVLHSSSNSSSHTSSPLHGQQRAHVIRQLQQRHVDDDDATLLLSRSRNLLARCAEAESPATSSTSTSTPQHNGRATVAPLSSTSDYTPPGSSNINGGSNGRLASTTRVGSSAKLSSYVLALRPWSFSASFIPVALGCALAHKATGEFNPLTWAVTCLTALSVHAAGNVVNTYYDYQKGIDSRKSSDDRTLVDELLTPDQLVHLGALLYCVGCAGFLLLVALSPARMEHLALVYFGGLSSSFVYTGGIGLKYIGLGEVLVLVIFGPITVLFAYTAQTGHLHPVTLLYAMPLALNTEAILHSNNSRDLEADRRVGIVTLAILLGHTGSHVLFALLLFVPYMLFAVMGLHLTPWLLLPLITVPNAFRLERHFRQGELQALPRLTAKLNVYFGLFYVIACVVAGRGQLPGLA